jgi:hypothetical protein
MAIVAAFPSMFVGSLIGTVLAALSGGHIDRHTGSGFGIFLAIIIGPTLTYYKVQDALEKRSYAHRVEEGSERRDALAAFEKQIAYRMAKIRELYATSPARARALEQNTDELIALKNRLVQGLDPNAACAQLEDIIDRWNRHFG